MLYVLQYMINYMDVSWYQFGDISCPAEVLRGSTTWCKCFRRFDLFCTFLYFETFFGQFKVLSRSFASSVGQGLPWKLGTFRRHKMAPSNLSHSFDHFLPLSPGTSAVFQLCAVLIFGLTTPWPNSLEQRSDFVWLFAALACRVQSDRLHVGRSVSHHATIALPMQCRWSNFSLLHRLRAWAESPTTQSVMR